MKNLTLITVLSLLLVSCGITKRDFEINSNVDVQENYLETTEASSLFDTSKEEITTAWWSKFNDPILDTLIGKAKAHNLDINTAIANFYASRALVKETKLDRLPTVTANGNVTRTRLGENIFVPGANPQFTTYNSTFDAFWETDVFGRVSNRIKGAYASQQLAAADMQGVYVSIFAEVARNYIELRGAQYQLDIANQNLKGQQETYDLTVRLSKAGKSNKLDESRALAQLENTRATIPPLKAQIEAKIV